MCINVEILKYLNFFRYNSFCRKEKCRQTLKVFTYGTCCDLILQILEWHLRTI